MFSLRFITFGLPVILAVFPLVTLLSIDTMSQLLDVNKLSTLTEDVDKIVALLAELKEECAKVELKYKKLFYGLDKIVDAINKKAVLDCKDSGVLYNDICLNYFKTPIKFFDAQQECLLLGGTLFQPNFNNPKLIEELKELFPELEIKQVYIDMLQICFQDGIVHQYSNGLVIPDDFLKENSDCNVPPSLRNVTGVAFRAPQIPCEQTQSYSLDFEAASSASVFKCFIIANIQLPYICQCDPIFKFPSGDIDLMPSEMDLEMIDLLNLHRNLKDQISQVEKELQDAATSFKVRKEANIVLE